MKQTRTEMKDDKRELTKRMNNQIMKEFEKANENVTNERKKMN